MTYRTPLGLGMALTLALAAAPARAADELKVGDKAPDFALMGSDGKTHSLADYKGKKAVVLAWFPKAFTGGCTAECKSFHEHGDILKQMDVVYFTASVDPVEDNTKFAKSLDVDYPILSDPDKAVARAYGVLNPKEMANRWTFYIDKEGRIAAIDKKVAARSAAQDVLVKIKVLGIADRAK